ncbi:hypothetical protein [Methanolobus chelungpuianus]|uniref:Uncharacterized protein n=1 Tax=Methanolobus chelungpuianus TaxID=502115 RepID=A0AAE3H9V0_9EURY|nr:hypothetical protein [Methanolobus chelungpuianus]MCQ6962238.1 hypothetical protein [Methanolobus chelungpuianus]
MDNCILIEKAVRRIADAYDLDLDKVEKAIYGSEFPLDLPGMMDDGLYCFRGPDDEVRYDNASICLSNRILANPGVARVLLSSIRSRMDQWDREDINDLLSLLRQAVSIMELNPDFYTVPGSYIDINHLPSERIPEDVNARYRIWSMDKKGVCLVGIDADRLMHIDDIRKSLSMI